MLYVFHVNNGDMITLDMSHAVESVSSLQKQIERLCRIPEEKQVLLVSGGQTLDPNTKVCTYSAGTDTNPIFLFSRGDVGSAPLSLLPSDLSSDMELRKKVAESQDLPPTYQTVITRTQIASQMYELGKEQIAACQSLVHDQHLQQQGWMAVIANLDDITAHLTLCKEKYELFYREFLGETDTYAKYVETFRDNLKLLNKIPLLPALRECAESEKSQSSPTNESNQGNQENLLDWIRCSDNQEVLDKLYNSCKRGLTEFNESYLDNLMGETNSMMELAQKQHLREMKGIGDRLFGLEQLLCKAKRLVQEQSDLAQSMLQNQTRAGNLGDTSILPDLCESHRRQLSVMLNNHKQICDIRHRCTKAKEELSNNIYTRLEWIQFTEEKITELQHKIIIHHDHMVRLQGHLAIMKQVHMAPTMYMNSVSEVVRRRAFSQAFSMWASDLACHLLTMYNEEVTRRKEFQAQFEGHFITPLFPGMEDMPSNFGTEAPSIFDSGLPKLTVDDISMLKEQLPEYSENLTLPDIDTLNNFFMVKSLRKPDVDESTTADDKLVRIVSNVDNMDRNVLKAVEGEQSILHGVPHLKDFDRGCESETDTEEFEKVSQSPFDKDMPPSPKPGTQDASTLTEVGERIQTPSQKKQLTRSFQKLHTFPEESLQRTLSLSSSNTDSFTNLKLESDVSFSSHHHCSPSNTNPHNTAKSTSPQSPRDGGGGGVVVVSGHQQTEFATDEFYIDESLPSSLSIETGQGEFVKQLDTANNVVALLQDNLESSRTEKDKLKSYLIKLASLSNENINQMRFDLAVLKSIVSDTKGSLWQKCESVGQFLDNFLEDQNRKDTEMTQQMTIEHELEVSGLKQAGLEMHEEMERLKETNTNLEIKLNSTLDENNALKMEIDECRDKVLKLESQLCMEVAAQEILLKETTEKLNRDHKAEIESIRSRFRLMTECNSPTDITSDDSAIKFIRESYEKQAKRDLEIALHHENKKWEKRLEELQFKCKMVMDEATRAVAEDKDKQIDLLKERENNLAAECLKYKTTIQQLAESDTMAEIKRLKLRLEEVVREKDQLQAELDGFKGSQIQDLGASVSVYEGKVDSATSPIKHKEKLTKSQTSLIKDGMIKISSCKAGDVVLVLWDEVHESYMILQESDYMYFLHSDCVDTLGLKPSGGDRRKFYCLGEVTDKEYCHARKSENRYNVPKGTRFYRIKVKALPSSKESLKRPTPMSQSQVTICSSEVETFKFNAAASSESCACQSMPTTPTRLKSVSECSSTDGSRESTVTGNTDMCESSLEAMTEEGNR